MLRALALLALAATLSAAGCAGADAPPEAPSTEARAPEAPATPAPPPPAATPDAPARPIPPAIVELGGSTTVEGRTLRFVEVVEDSRCPEGVDCIQAGRAQIRLAIGADQAVLSVPHARMGDDETATAVLDGLTVTLQSLDPYPGSAAAQAGEPVRAVLAVR
ncbi:hypothetical protein [Rubrivirga sp. IMCC45206]|uniref:hypothetical protein n=1 Tax=Rubrivirga sp. IMCC45206 TaxID=3391614 RepID=UPI00398F9847